MNISQLQQTEIAPNIATFPSNILGHYPLQFYTLNLDNITVVAYTTGTSSTYRFEKMHGVTLATLTHRKTRQKVPSWQRVRNGFLQN